ncbi:MAG TPA: hypothetical protein VJL58_06285 [Pyrinomonadaceae bacterium]|nr:hypothetical protein [Pyrinomonadaceae bacterium]
MKTTTALFFAFVMIVSIAFVGEAISSDNSFSASAQTRTRTRKRPGWAKRQYGRGERGTRYSAHKTKRGTKYSFHKGKRGSKWTYRKGKHGTKKVVSRTKKIFS